MTCQPPETLNCGMIHSTARVVDQIMVGDASESISIGTWIVKGKEIKNQWFVGPSPLSVTPSSVRPSSGQQTLGAKASAAATASGK